MVAAQKCEAGNGDHGELVIRYNVATGRREKELETRERNKKCVGFEAMKEICTNGGSSKMRGWVTVTVLNLEFSTTHSRGYRQGDSGHETA